MRPEKNLIINEIKSRIDKTPYVLLADYTGMQVPEFNELRNRLFGAKAEFRVVKNTLLRRALKDSNLPDLETYLNGQSAVVLGESDISAAAKVLKNFTAEFQKPKLKVGILDRAVLDVTQIMALADLPSKEVLQAKLLGLLLAPASTLVRLINTPASQVAQVLKAYVDKGVPVTPEKPKTAAAPIAEVKTAAEPAVEAKPVPEPKPVEVAPVAEAKPEVAQPVVAKAEPAPAAVEVAAETKPAAVAPVVEIKPEAAEPAPAPVHAPMAKPVASAAPAPGAVESAPVAALPVTEEPPAA